jgi:hypothetical protein
MKVVIYKSDFDINKYDLNDFVDLMNQETVIAFNVTTDQFRAIHTKLMHNIAEYEYVQEFFTDSNSDNLFYYRPVEFDKTKVKTFLIKELNK